MGGELVHCPRCKATHFEAGYYDIVQTLSPNIVIVRAYTGASEYSIQLEGVGSDTTREELDKWAQTGWIVHVRPREILENGNIVSDLWLGNIHLNIQFKSHRDRVPPYVSPWKRLWMRLVGA